jgi:CheY-like chemotaxis protein
MTSIRILAVDDEPTILASLQHILKDKYTVIIASGGQEALDLLDLHNGEFDAILADLSMPDINGATLYLRISEKYPGLEDHIIFMTGGPYGAYIDESALHDKNPCIAKPFKVDELNNLVEKFLLKFAK